MIMDDMFCFLITLTDGECLLRCAVKIHTSKLSDDMINYPLEYRALYAEKLPLHVRSFGNIVQVERIFEIVNA